MSRVPAATDGRKRRTSEKESPLSRQHAQQPQVVPPLGKAGPQQMRRDQGHSAADANGHRSWQGMRVHTSPGPRRQMPFQLMGKGDQGKGGADPAPKHHSG